MKKNAKILLIATVIELLAVLGILVVVEPARTWLAINLKEIAKWLITPQR